jgi:hypothetical protein
MRSMITYTLVLFACAVFVSESQAQYPGSRFGTFGGAGVRPPVSPYLNLLNTGDPAINYYGLVRPQFAYNRAIQNLGNELNYLEATPQGNLPPSQTGIRSTFMTQYKYFMNNGYGGGGGYRPGAGYYGAGNYTSGTYGGSAGGINPPQTASPQGTPYQPAQGQPR